METECNREKYLFQDLKSRQVEATFDGGDITSDGGAVLIRELSERLGCAPDILNTDYSWGMMPRRRTGYAGGSATPKDLQRDAGP